MSLTRDKHQEDRPSRKHTMQDRLNRTEVRRCERERMMASKEITNEMAVHMALMGYGIEPIHARTGIEKSVLRRLVLGEL